MTDYTELKRLAEAATQGWWARTDGNEVSISHDGDESFWSWEQAGPAQVSGSGTQSVADADFIAAVNPAAILALIEDNEHLLRFKAAYVEWRDKTDWVQQSARPKELGMHRADVLKGRIEGLHSEVETLLNTISGAREFVMHEAEVRGFLDESNQVSHAHPRRKALVEVLDAAMSKETCLD